MYASFEIAERKKIEKISFRSGSDGGKGRGGGRRTLIQTLLLSLSSLEPPSAPLPSPQHLFVEEEDQLVLRSCLATVDFLVQPSSRTAGRGKEGDHQRFDLLSFFLSFPRHHLHRLDSSLDTRTHLHTRPTLLVLLLNSQLRRRTLALVPRFFVFYSRNAPPSFAFFPPSPPSLLHPPPPPPSPLSTSRLDLSSTFPIPRSSLRPQQLSNSSLLLLTRPTDGDDQPFLLFEMIKRPSASSRRVGLGRRRRG